MNVFSDLLSFLRQERFQQFLEQTPFGIFYKLHNIKIQCQLLQHLLLLESENVRDDMFIVEINGTKLHFGIKEFTAVTGLKCRLLTNFVSDPSIPNRLITKYFGEMNKVPKLAFLNKGNKCFRLTLKACSRRLENNKTSFSQFHLALQIWFYECFIRLTTQLLSVNDVDFDEKYVELKKEIAEVRVELKELKDNDDAHQHVEESEKAPMDQPSVSLRKYVDISNTDDMRINLNIISEAQISIDQIFGGVFNADIPGSSTSKPPTLDDYPNLTMTQIIELDLILNANITLDVQPRNRNPRKYDKSLLRRVPIFFRIKHPFESRNGFEVDAELIDELNKWVFKDVSSRRGRKSAYSNLKYNFEPQMDFGVVKVSKKNFFQHND
ncbi:hypothetical protein R3W88_009231 [Solanum pinnatisectum]|uniref:Uncharacterized protein n=1 Tax=Solanum pinnatisectum TaxID=50273 RepID=A0AAV9MD45_9SOLN|nr:hypothetical protein R3W88_009231 [Solanum pinnatisectum]